MTATTINVPTDKSWAETAKRNGLDDETVTWLQIRAEEALKIDPETAETDWGYGTGDPYKLFPTPEEYPDIGREYWARRPGSDIWVSFDDLPDVTREAIWDRHKRKLAFPAGLEAIR